MNLTSIQLDRAVGAVLASAAADALGSQYEFGPELADDFTPVFGRGIFGHAPGEFTDDTSMAVPILDALAAGADLNDAHTREEVVARWIDWSRTAKDVGAQTRSVLSRIPQSFTEADVRQASREQHDSTGRSGGNGSLMRTGPLALGYLNAPREELASAARAVSELTHWEADNASACILWTVAIRHAILTGELDIARGLDLLPADDASRWAEIIDEALAPGAHPRDFRAKNGWVVRAFQGALAAVAGATSLVDAIERAIRGGNDTDTVAAIAGSLAGALWGGTAVPLSWKRKIHGWPGYNANDLVCQAALAARNGRTDGSGWPLEKMAQPGVRRPGTFEQHPVDPGVLLGSVATLDTLPIEVDAVVSLCRVGAEQVPARVESIQVWLVDQPDRNANLDFTLAEAADMIAALRAEDKTVFVHCAEARSRTSAVAALYSARNLGGALDEAWGGIRNTLPDYDPKRFLRDAVGRIVGGE